MAEAAMKYEHGTVEFVADRAYSSGQLITVPDGRVGVVAGLKAVESGDVVAARINGIHAVAKVSGVAMLAGQEAFFIPTTSNISYNAAGRIYAGVVVRDAAMSDTTVYIDLNAVSRSEIDYPHGRQNTWTTTAVDGLGTVFTADPPPHAVLAFDAVTEAAKAVLLCDQAIAVANNNRMEIVWAPYDIGDSNTLDMDIGLASGDHATDFETIAEFVAFHLDGAALDLLAHSDDGTTDVAAVDTTVNVVDNTYIHLMIDASDVTDCKLYANGVRVLDGTTGAATTLTLAAATGPLKPIVHMEKTSNDTTAEMRVRRLRAWSQAG